MATSHVPHESPDAAVFCQDDSAWDWQFHMDYLDVLRDLIDEGFFNERRPEDHLAQSLMVRSMNDLSAAERCLFEAHLQPILEARCVDPDKFASEYERRRLGLSRDRHPISHQAGRLAA
ncbi:hypothetical protein M2281_003917 [Mesorhizobium soli]|uniref:hypothetical protein n=1 Tax=Pseudaminobacter soli (ex Li et al. 2025) TaxID=1295366 RepID=UPI0024748AFE|nr:hypothetical protein [Mesorhizobium soli]MDH6233306.1 hypothetical protein [Mesorhizobium soli]